MNGNVYVDDRRTPRLKSHLSRYPCGCEELCRFRHLPANCAWYESFFCLVRWTRAIVFPRSLFCFDCTAPLWSRGLPPREVKGAGHGASYILSRPAQVAVHVRCPLAYYTSSCARHLSQVVWGTVESLGQGAPLEVRSRPRRDRRRLGIRTGGCGPYGSMQAGDWEVYLLQPASQDDALLRSRTRSAITKQVGEEDSAPPRTSRSKQEARAALPRRTGRGEMSSRNSVLHKGSELLTHCRKNPTEEGEPKC